VRLQTRSARVPIGISDRSSLALTAGWWLVSGSMILALGCGAGDVGGGGGRSDGGTTGTGAQGGSGGAATGGTRGTSGGQGGSGGSTTGGTGGTSGGQGGSGGSITGGTGGTGGQAGTSGAGGSTGGAAGTGGQAGTTGTGGAGTGGQAGTVGKDGGAGTAGTAGAAGSGGSGGTGSTDAGSSGCGKAWTGADITQEMRNGRAPMQVARRTIMVGGVNREYLVAVPKTYDPAKLYPLVFGLHGSGGTREQLRGYMDVETPANQGAVFIYPTGLPQDDGGVNEWDLSATSVDLVLMDSLLAQYSSELCIDMKRIFATGHSFGGCMSNALGCFRGVTFRAIAPVAGCSGTRATGCTGRIATLQIHSPKDTSTQYSGAIGACTRYLRANTCDEMPACGCYYMDNVTDPARQCMQTAWQPYMTAISLAATAQDEQPPVARSYVNCDDAYPVGFVDHWRRERQMVGDPAERWHNPPPWSGALVWEFFSRLPEAPIE
jgi:poly(3-hydroxybutyrate) depolymerase